VEEIQETVTESPVGGSEKILLVEDEKAVRNLVRYALTRQGYTVLDASDPLEAMSLFESHSSDIDMLLTDVVMPGMNGRELVDKMHTTNPNLKILYMSGYNEDIIAHHGVLDEHTCFIQKPFSNKELADKVRRVLDNTLV
jgi:CheY-like chemotaxis protein